MVDNDLWLDLMTIYCLKPFQHMGSRISASFPCNASEAEKGLYDQFRVTHLSKRFTYMNT